MKIEVGSKWENKYGSVKILAVTEHAVLFQYEDGEVQGETKFWFKKEFTLIPQFEWKKVECVEFSDGDRIKYGMFWGDKDFELLYNYKRYIKEVNDGDCDCVVLFKDLGTLYFSTKEHAKEFYKLAKENGCIE